ncbi:energy transducer TonB [Ideonella livida]|uniref:TonB family protein n=1 Tax=Ideonella livida TaxID=2707176 RepID=A0A7C9PJ30_9BURK|nr:energy transducer TonB [Ideonella livida]NDY93275.1 TonB family protein [Ideonella livida]
MRVPTSPWRPTLMTWAVALSLAAHAVLLSIRFVDPERFSRVFEDSPLEVILVNARSAQKPLKAQALAQASLEGGGDADLGRATSPLPPSAMSLAGDGLDDAYRSIEQMQDEQRQLLVAAKRALSLLPPPDPTLAKDSPERARQEQKRRQMERQIAEIEKRIQEENARPRRKHVHPATQEVAYAQYYDALRRKVEERGTQDFPTHKGQKLYGELMVNFVVDARGQVVTAEVVQRSKSRELDRRAVAILRAAAPFGAFSADMRRQADEILITSRFRFTRLEALETTLSVNAAP